MQSGASNAGTYRKEWILKKETELRCEAKENEWLTVRLTNGLAELFGVELAQNKEYTFHDQNFAIFTWYGCTIETISNITGGDGSSIYVADTTPMIAYVNTHIQLEARRDVALANNDFGPRVVIVGGTDAGKSSFSHILTAYAVRLDRTPIFVDLDVGQSSISIPGTIAAVPLDKSCLSVEVILFVCSLSVRFRCPHFVGRFCEL
jgi:polyribonucleotide 5'-hydroxyl-kinase